MISWSIRKRYVIVMTKVFRKKREESELVEVVLDNEVVKNWAFYLTGTQL